MLLVYLTVVLSSGGFFHITALATQHFAKLTYVHNATASTPARQVITAAFIQSQGQGNTMAFPTLTCGTQELLANTKGHNDNGTDA